MCSEAAADFGYILIKDAEIMAPHNIAIRRRVALTALIIS